MKRIFVLLLVVLLCGCSRVPITENTEKTSQQHIENAAYVKSVWIAYYELQDMIKDTEASFSKLINKRFKQLKDIGFNTITVQVRPCADAFYISAYYPSSKYCFGCQGVYMPYDPLSVMCDSAHNLGLRIEAWINPYRVSQDNKIEELCDTNIAKKWYSTKSKKSHIYVAKNGIFFNPACDDVTRLIVNGVKEIVTNYDIDAIHFDDYFYPTTDKSIDSKEYGLYKSGGGTLSLSAWRRDKVSNMVHSVYSVIKDTDNNVQFGISPAANIDNNYNSLYADVKKWCTQDGYIDYICPQVYYGFYSDTMPFMSTVKKWVKLSKKPIYIGLPLYKADTVDRYASASNKRAINEFKNKSNIISRQIDYIAHFDSIDGYYIFSYNCLLDDNCKKEVSNMMGALSNS